jgi:Phage uncharacterised protein (Phage_XkdX)
MDWFAFAKSDWEVYHDTNRTQKYVQFNKITPEQYESITGNPYQVA